MSCIKLNNYYIKDIDKIIDDNINFPIYVSTKFDGVRALVIDGIVYSRSMKPIRNKHVQKLFGKPEYNGFDGVGDFNA